MPILTRLLVLVALTAGVARAQIVTGTVTDAETGEGLPAATVQVAGTYSGTIANGAGRFELRVPDRPATLVVRFIGYESAEIVVEAGQERFDIALEPAAIVSPEVVVTEENPAEAIMRRVIERKAVWQAGLQSWRADAYVRQVFGREGEIVGLAEGVSEAYWQRGEGIREVVTGTRRSENLPDFGGLEVADAVVNFYDDEIDFGGYDLMGPTSPEALDFYRFTLDGVRTLGDELVYDIGLQPKSGLQPGFEGRVSVLGGVWALIDVALRPNESVRFPFVSAFGVAYEQQFSSFGQTVAGEAVWLPVDFRLTATARLGMIGLQFPRAELKTVARLTDYAVNVAVPDSLFERRRQVVDSVAVASGAAFGSGNVVPLEPREAEAYARLDSTDSIEEAFRPTGALARFIDFTADDDEVSVSGGSGGSGGPGLGLGFSPSLWFNRVEGLHLGGSVSRRLGPVRARAGAGYSVEPERLTYRGSLEARLPTPRAVRLTAALGGHREIVPRVASQAHGRFVNTVGLLAGGPDYFDYYEREGGWIEVGLRLHRLRTGLMLRGTAERHRSLRAVTSFTAFGEDATPRPNPRIEAGDLRSVGAELTVGDEPGGIEGSVMGQRGLRLAVEVSDGALGSDYDFVRAEGALAWRIPTFLQRRLFPNTLDLRLAGGLHGGALPIQRHFGVDGTVLGFAPSGVFRSLRGRPVEGDRYAAAMWEHDFRSVPFELLGLDAFAARNIGLILFGAHGRTWLDESRVDPFVPLRTADGWIHEVGVSISGGFFLPVRLDLAYRLDDPGLFVAFGLARLF